MVSFGSRTAGITLQFTAPSGEGCRVADSAHGVSRCDMVSGVRAPLAGADPTTRPSFQVLPPWYFQTLPSTVRCRRARYAGWRYDVTGVRRQPTRPTQPSCVLHESVVPAMFQWACEASGSHDRSPRSLHGVCGKTALLAVCRHTDEPVDSGCHNQPSRVAPCFLRASQAFTLPQASVPTGIRPNMHQSHQASMPRTSEAGARHSRGIHSRPQGSASLKGDTQQLSQTHESNSLDQSESGTRTESRVARASRS